MPIQIRFASRWPRRLVLWLCLALSLPAWAAPPNSPPAGVPAEISTDDLRGVVGALENDAERQKLIYALKALIAARDQAAAGQPQSTTPTAAQGNASEKAAQTDSTGALLIVGISERLRDVSASLTGAAAILADFPSILDWGRRQILDPESRLAWLSICGKLVAVLGIALFAQWAVYYGLRRARIGVADRRVAAMWLRLALLVPRIAVDLVPIAAFATVADALLPFMKPDEIVSITAVTAVNATVVARSAIAVASQVLMPQGPTADLLEVSDETAGYWHEWIRRLVILAVYGYFAA